MPVRVVVVNSVGDVNGEHSCIERVLMLSSLLLLLVLLLAGPIGSCLAS